MQRLWAAELSSGQCLQSVLSQGQIMATSALVLGPWGGVAHSERRHTLLKLQGCQSTHAQACAPRADMHVKVSPTSQRVRRRAASSVSASASEPISSGTVSLDETYATAPGHHSGQLPCHSQCLFSHSDTNAKGAVMMNVLILRE